MNLACQPLEEIHHLTLQEISSHSLNKIQLVFSTGAIIGLTFDENSADQVVSCVIR